MRKIYVIGIGSGDPEHVTVQAINAMNKVDVFLLVDKGAEKEELLNVRRDICERYIDEKSNYRFVNLPERTRNADAETYQQGVADWHKERAKLYAEAIRNEVPEDGCGAFLVWGDPAWYDSTIRIVEAILAEGTVAFDYEIIAGLSSFQVLAAKNKMPLNAVGAPVLITTGRKIADEGVPAGIDDVVVMLNGGPTFQTLKGQNFDIYWGAYVGMKEEVLHSGPLDEVADHIAKARSDLRAANGWVMDAYILRRSKGGASK